MQKITEEGTKSLRRELIGSSSVDMLRGSDEACTEIPITLYYAKPCAGVRSSHECNSCTHQSTTIVAEATVWTTSLNKHKT